jgi:hypothetical protein
VSVCVCVLCVFTKNIAQKPVEGRETVEEAFSCTPPEIVQQKNQNAHFQSMDCFSKTVIIVLLMSIHIVNN